MHRLGSKITPKKKNRYSVGARGWFKNYIVCFLKYNYGSCPFSVLRIIPRLLYLRFSCGTLKRVYHFFFFFTQKTLRFHFRLYMLGGTRKR